MTTWTFQTKLFSLLVHFPILLSYKSFLFENYRFKQLNERDSSAIEGAYQEYLEKSEVAGSSRQMGRVYVDGKIEVDFDALMMYKPSKKKIRRTFMTGLWVQMKSSPNQLQLHAKVNRLQIDNQMYDCLFPVVLAPVPPPKSVALDNGERRQLFNKMVCFYYLISVHKPFVEVSIVQLLIKHSQIRQFKYFKVLIQEFDVKVELGFINALLEVLQSSEYTDQEEVVPSKHAFL